MAALGGHYDYRFATHLLKDGVDLLVLLTLKNSARPRPLLDCRVLSPHYPQHD